MIAVLGLLALVGLVVWGVSLIPKGPRVSWGYTPPRRNYKTGTHYTIAVAGYSHRQFRIALTKVHTPVVLVRERSNIHDPNAIAIYTVKRGRVHRLIGYVPRSRAVRLALKMDCGARFHGIVSRKWVQGEGQHRFDRLETTMDLVSGQ